MEQIHHIMRNSTIVKPTYGTEFYRQYNGVMYHIDTPLSLIALIDEYMDKPQIPENRLYFHYGNPQTLHLWGEVSRGYPDVGHLEPRIPLLRKKVDVDVSEPIMEHKVLIVYRAYTHVRKLLWDITQAIDTKKNYTNIKTDDQKFIDKYTLDIYNNDDDEEDYDE